MLTSLAPARRRLVLATLAALVVLVAAAVITAVVRASAHTTPVDQAQPGPVIIVPGYGGSKTGPDVLAAALRTVGKDVTVLTLPDAGEGDLDAQAVVLGAAVKAAITRTHSASVDVVGYSAGGVVARLWVRDHGGASLARRVVTLGSPQHGTTLASVGVLVPGECPAACQELTPDSALLRGLNSGDETPSGPVFVSIWTTADTVVLPPDSADLTGALNLTVQSLCPSDAVDHTGLPADPVVAQMVLAELGTGSPATPTVSCARP